MIPLIKSLVRPKEKEVINVIIPWIDHFQRTKIQLNSEATRIQTKEIGWPSLACWLWWSMTYLENTVGYLLGLSCTFRGVSYVSDVAHAV